MREKKNSKDDLIKIRTKLRWGRNIIEANCLVGLAILLIKLPRLEEAWFSPINKKYI